MARRTFRVEHIQEGLEQIKQELGASAIIVRTRRVTDDDGRRVLEIIAESDNPSLNEELSGEESAESGAFGAPSTATAQALTQVQKTMLAMTEQIQRVQSEVRHLRLEVQSVSMPSLSEEQSEAIERGEQATTIEALGLRPSPALFEALYAEDLRALRLAVAQLRDHSGDRQLFETVVEIHSALSAQGVLPAQVDMLCARLLASNRLGESLFERAAEAISETLTVTKPPWEVSARSAASPVNVQLFLGPSGSGKTSTIAKIAAHASIKADRRVGLIGADAYRIGGHDQIETYAELIGVPAASCEGLGMLPQAIKVLRTQHEQLDLILVDATSFDPFVESAESAPDSAADLHGVMSLVLPEGCALQTFLVAPATWGATALTEYLGAARLAQPVGVIWTMMDVARRFGALYSVAREVALPMALWSTGREVPGELRAPQPRALAEALLMDKKSI